MGTPKSTSAEKTAKKKPIVVFDKLNISEKFIAEVKKLNKPKISDADTPGLTDLLDDISFGTIAIDSATLTVNLVITDKEILGKADEDNASVAQEIRNTVPLSKLVNKLANAYLESRNHFFDTLRAAGFGSGGTRNINTPEEAAYYDNLSKVESFEFEKKAEQIIDDFKAEAEKVVVTAYDVKSNYKWFKFKSRLTLGIKSTAVTGAALAFATAGTLNPAFFVALGALFKSSVDTARQIYMYCESIEQTIAVVRSKLNDLIKEIEKKTGHNAKEVTRIIINTFTPSAEFLNLTSDIAGQCKLINGKLLGLKCKRVDMGRQLSELLDIQVILYDNLSPDEQLIFREKEGKELEELFKSGDAKKIHGNMIKVCDLITNKYSNLDGRVKNAEKENKEISEDMKSVNGSKSVSVAIFEKFLKYTTSAALTLVGDVDQAVTGTIDTINEGAELTEKVINSGAKVTSAAARHTQDMRDLYADVTGLYKNYSLKFEKLAEPKG